MKYILSGLSLLIFISVASLVHSETAEEHWKKGDIYLKQGNYTEAILEYTKVIEMNPKDTFAYGARASAYLGQNNYTQAISDDTKAIEIDPDNVVSYSTRGDSYRLLGNYAQATIDLTKAIEMNPKDASAYRGLGNICSLKGNNAQAIIYLTKAIEINPKEADLYFMRGFAYHVLKEDDKAWADAQIAHSLGYKSPSDSYVFGSK